MNTFKQIDTWISILLISIFVILTCIRQDYIFMTGYFVVGAWQVISMVIHIYKKKFTGKGGLRDLYHWIVFWIFLVTALGFLITPLLMLVMYVMLFAAPVMAVCYTVMCYQETYVKLRRPLSLLK